SAASSSSAGAIIRHGPHQAAQQSSRTGRAEDASTTSRAKVASVTASGLVVSDDEAADAPPRAAFAPAPPPSPSSLAPHLPHTGCLPTTVTRSSTRFFAPQLSHASIATAVPPRPKTFLHGVFFLRECDTTPGACESVARCS